MTGFVWGVVDTTPHSYALDAVNADISYHDIANERSYHTQRADLDKRHPGINNQTIQRFMRLTHL